MKVVVMGQGYVGLPLAMAAARAGHYVVGFEPDKKRCDLLASGVSYIEDVSGDSIIRRMEEGLYKPTYAESDLSNYDVAVITVPTPLRKGAPDLGYVSAATATLSLYLKKGAVVVLESTVAPGTTRTVIAPILEVASELKAGEDFHVGFSPERIDPGNQDWTFENTPKLVSGLTDRCRDIVAVFYSTITQTVVTAGTPEEAEMAKVFENTYRQVNIALAIELQRHAHRIGVDVHNVLELAATKPFGFTKFTPGPGVGGHCLPVDPVYLSHHLRTETGAPFRIVELAQEINDAQPAYVVQRLQDALNARHGLSLRQARILALGAAYKPNTADCRESPAVEVAEHLREKGALVTVVDPCLEPDGDQQLADVPYAADARDTISVGDYDAVVLLTPHDAFDLTQLAAEANYVLDTRGVMPTAPHIERL